MNGHRLIADPACILRAAPRLKVCHISLGLSTGGLERLLADFARFHDPARFEPCFVALHGLGRPAEDIRLAGCDVHALQSAEQGRWTVLARLTSLLRKLQPDIVHTHNAAPHFHGTVAARLAGVPVVVHTRHGQHFGHTRRASFQFRTICRWVNRVVAVSEDAARLCCEHNGVPSKKVASIWNGIDLNRFKFRGPAADPVAISVARLSPEKDFGTLLRATAQVVRTIPEFRLRIVGNGSEMPRLQSLAAELGLGSHVELLGERRDIPDLLAQAGFFVSSSLTEGISLTLLEAMAVGLPVLATAVGGNSEVVADGITGRLVPAAQPDALAAGMIALCRASAEWPELGRQGRARVEELFDVRHMLRNYEALYDELIEARREKRAGHCAATVAGEPGSALAGAGSRGAQGQRRSNGE